MPDRINRTSQAAAFRKIGADGLLSPLRRAVYDVVYLFDYGEGVTSGEVDRTMSRTGRYTRSGSPRLSELVRLGVIEECGRRVCSATGQRVIAYRTTGRLPDPAGLPRRRKARKRRGPLVCPVSPEASLTLWPAPEW